jgi:hypothetical protein
VGLRARWSSVAPGAKVAVLVTVLLVPLAVAAVALRRPQWFPVLDLAMTELRLRDVLTSETPLIGLPGRIGRFPEQGSHPGPMSFYALWPTWKLLGSSAWGMQVGALVLNALAATGAVLVARRRGGLRLALGVATILALLMSGYGISTLAEPWNPYLPIMWWFLALLAVWSVLCDDVAMLPVAVGASSMAAQTHVPYLGLCIGIVGVALAYLAWSLVQHPARRAHVLRWLAAAAALTALLWSPLVVDQLRATDERPGNLTMLWNHFTDPPAEEGDPIGFGAGVELALRHLDVTGFLSDAGDSLGSLARSSGDPGGSVVPGVAVLLVWLASVVVAWRRRHELILKLDAVVAVALVLGAFSMSRIFGKVWYYLMLWAWGTLGLLLLAVVWTVLDALDDERARRVVLGVGLAVTVVAAALLAGTAADVDPPAPQLSAVLADVVPPTADALDEDQRYLVTWDDGFYIGSQGYGLVSDLERVGHDVCVPSTWRVPVTHHRVCDPSEVDGEIKLAVGIYVDRWRDVPDARELAFSDPRSDDQRAEYERLRRDVAAGLEDEGLGDLVPLLDGNLFGASLDPRLTDDLREGIERMLDLGSPGAVFLVPPGRLLPPAPA